MAQTGLHLKLQCVHLENCSLQISTCLLLPHVRWWSSHSTGLIDKNPIASSWISVEYKLGALDWTDPVDSNIVVPCCSYFLHDSGTPKDFQMDWPMISPIEIPWKIPWKIPLNISFNAIEWPEISHEIPLRPSFPGQEQQFFDWLGVEEMCCRPQLVLQRLSSAQGVIHPFLQEGLVMYMASWWLMVVYDGS